MAGVGVTGGGVTVGVTLMIGAVHCLALISWGEGTEVL